MARPTVVLYNNSAESRAIGRNIYFIGLQDVSVLQELLASNDCAIVPYLSVTMFFKLEDTKGFSLGCHCRSSCHFRLSHLLEFLRLLHRISSIRGLLRIFNEGKRQLPVSGSHWLGKAVALVLLNCHDAAWWWQWGSSFWTDDRWASSCTLMNLDLSSLKAEIQD